jgi:tRNA-dihydrouridine synthase 4
MDECKKICKEANVKGVMCARGLLENPALFANYDITPVQCVKDWVNIAIEYGTPFSYFHQVLIQMLQHVLPKNERRFFNALMSTSSILDFLNDYVFLNE